MIIKPIGTNVTEIVLHDGTMLLLSYKTCVAATTADGCYRTDTQWSKTTSSHINANGYRDRATKPQSYFDNLLTKI